MLSNNLSDRSELDESLFEQRLKLCYQALNQSLLAILVISTLMLVLLRDGVNHLSLITWYALVIAVTVYRVLTQRRYLRQNNTPKSLARAYWHMLIGSLLSGLSWGLAGVVLFSDQVFYQALLAFIIAGMSAGGMVNLAPFLKVALSFLVLILAPFLLRLLLEGTTEALQMASMVFLFLLLMSVSVRRIHQTVIEGLRMRFLRQRAEDKVYQQAYYDDMTGLSNRRMLLDRLHQELARSHRGNNQGALVLLDIDHFKHINDSFGHTVGDGLLREVAKRLQKHLREHDTAARLGGDEFVVLLTNMQGRSETVAQNVRSIVEEIRIGLSEPFEIDDYHLHSSASMGVALFPADSQTSDELLKHADTAMYRAKAEGRNVVRFFLREMQQIIEDRRKLEGELRQALEKDQLSLYVQPLVRADGSAFAGEVLIRWVREDGTMVPPDEFIPVAEETGLIVEVGDWVLGRACEYVKTLSGFEWLDNFSYLSVNISPREFRQKRFVERVIDQFNRHEIDPHGLEFEITENVPVMDFIDTAHKMQQLRKTGTSFSIDDFGTGYSSMANLKQLPLDTLKIDQSFVRDVISDENAATLVRAMLSMSQMLGLKTIAEGVETPEVQAFLKRNGCLYFQGYLHAKPMPFDQFVDYLKQHKKSVPVNLLAT